jgi:flagellar hook-associated protein 1 FlgK
MISTDLSLLSLAGNAISAQNAGIAVATNNVANANTTGYSQEVVGFEAVDAGAGQIGGVTTGATNRVADDLISARIRANTGTLAAANTQSDSLGDLETTLSASPTTADSLASLYAAFDQVAASPNNQTLRDAAVTALQSTVSSIHDAASTVATAVSDADSQVGTIAQQATSLAAQLAQANVAAQSGDPTALDNRDQIANQLAQLVGGQATVGSNGMMRFTLDGGAVLVDGTNAATMTTQTDPTTGLDDVLVSDGTGTRDVTSQITSGQLGGTLSVRSQATAIGAQYDQLAFDLATSMNATASANAAPDGTTGHDLFVQPTTVAGAAASLAVDPTLAASSAELPTASPGAGAGDGSGALALYNLSSQNVASGGTATLTNASLNILAGLGTQAATANANVQTDQTVATNLSNLQDSVSGVDITQQQANLSQFEDTVSSLTQFTSSIDSMMTNLVQNI